MMKKYRVKISNFVFGVPPTFIVDNYNPEQFSLVNIINRYPIIDDPVWNNPKGTFATAINGKPIYTRLLIKNK